MHTHSDAHTTLTHTAVTDKGNATQLQRSTDLHYQMVVPIGSPDTHTHTGEVSCCRTQIHTTYYSHKTDKKLGV